MSFTKIFFILYGIILLAGAYFGWKAGSKISLIMAICSGILVLFSVYVAAGNPILGYRLLTVLSGILSIIFILRFMKTHSMMPAGMLLILSLAALAVSLSQIFRK